MPRPPFVPAVLSCVFTPKALTLALLVGLTACSRGPSPAEVAAQRSAAEAALVARPEAAAEPVASPPPAVQEAPREAAPAPRPDPAAEEAEKRAIAEHLYREMNPSIPEKDRREAAWVMAEDLMQMGRDARGEGAPTGAERERLEREAQERERVGARQRQCEELRNTVEVQERLLRERPREQMTAEQRAVITGAVEEGRKRLPQLCP
jgi:hypothetical protein